MCQIFTGQRLKPDLFHGRAGVLDRYQLADQWMTDIHFIVSISADQHQVAYIGFGQKVFQQVEGCCIEPLQVVEKKYKRMF